MLWRRARKPKRPPAGWLHFRQPAEVVERYDEKVKIARVRRTALGITPIEHRGDPIIKKGKERVEGHQ